MLLKAYLDPETEKQKKEFRDILERRYKAVKAFVSSHTSKEVEPLPFNSGYFMSFHTKSVDAEILRQKLLKEQGIGTISIDAHTLRVAFSSLDEDKIDIVYKAIYDTADKLAQ